MVAILCVTVSLPPNDWLLSPIGSLFPPVVPMISSIIGEFSLGADPPDIRFSSMMFLVIKWMLEAGLSVALSSSRVPYVTHTLSHLEISALFASRGEAIALSF